MININVEMQYDAPREGGTSNPLSFDQIAEIRSLVNAPDEATIQLEDAPYGWEVRVHWQHRDPWEQRMNG